MNKVIVSDSALRETIRQLIPEGGSYEHDGFNTNQLEHENNYVEEEDVIND